MKAISKKTVLISTLVATLGLGTAAATFAGDHGKGCWGKKGEHSGMMRGGHSLADRLEDKLDLSKDQVTKIDEITDAQHKLMRELRREKRDQAKAVFALDPTSAEYDAEVDKLAQQAGERAEKIMRARADTRASIAAVLTPEQQEKMTSLKEEMKEKWQSRRHGRDHGEG